MQEMNDKAGTGGLEVIEFEQFDTSFAVSPTDEGATRRRYMTLLVEHEDEHAQSTRLSDAQLLHVQNTEGTSFALKRLRPVPQDADPFARRGREAALFEEYRNQLAVSQLKGFPDVFGYGVTHEGDPGILMEWIEGQTLREASASGLIPREKDGGAPGTAVAAIALSVLQTLISTEYLEGTFVHRDISPRNIMIRTDESTPFKDGSDPETCLIDLGSSIFMRKDDASFTTTMDVWRAATPEYAPPEMLALNDRSQILARRSPSIDIYALASVLYELYAGQTPFRLADHPGEDAYLLKTQSEPHPLEPRTPKDRGLTDAIMACIKVPQAERPNARILFREIAAWQKETTGRTSALRHEEIPSRRSGTRLWTSEHQETPRRFQKIQTETLGNPAAAEPAKRHPALTRRSFLIGAGVVAAAAVAGFGAYEALRPKSFGEKSWSEISDIASAIAGAASLDEAASIAHDKGIADEDGSVADGLTKSIALADGTTASVQVVGYWHDDTEDGGKAGLTFAFTDPIAARAMADASMPEGGWEQCSMRSWLADDFMASMPDELASIIVPAVKLTNNAGSTRTADSVTTTTDSIWLFSMAELGGTRKAETFASGYGYLADIVNAEGTQYEYWKDQSVSITARLNEATQRKWQGKDCYWWTRSPSPDCSEDGGETWFNRVGPNGDVFDFATVATGDEYTSCVLPGFCI
ncbi:MAG: DUF6273 domain-containing protein [Atopobiaceae bacterium]